MRIVSTSKEVKCHIWPDGNLHGTYKPNISSNTTIKSVSWAKDGGWMVIVPENGKSEIVSFYDTPKLLHTIHDFHKATCACFQTSTKRNVVLGTSSGQLLMYDIKHKSVIKSFPSTPTGLFKLQYNYKGSHLIGGCDDGKAYVYNNNSGILSSSIKVPKSKTLTNFKYHPAKRNFVAGCAEEGIVCVWDINTSKSIVHSELHRAPVNDVTFSISQSELIISLGMDSIISFYDYRSNKLVYTLCTPKPPMALDAPFNSNNIAVGSQDGRILLYDLRDLSEAVFKFEHDSRIKQIMFESASDDHASVIGIPEPEEAQIKSKNESDTQANSFGNVIFGQPVPDIQETKSNTKGSFLDVIGFNSPVNLSGRTKSVTLQNLTDSRPVPATTPDPASESKSQLKTQVDKFINKCNYISTPVGGTKQDLFSNISPILMSTNDLNVNSNDEVKRVLREAVREEMEVFKEEIRYQTWDLMGCLRRHTMDLQMMMIKEFTTVEDKIQGMRKELLKDK